MRKSVNKLKNNLTRNLLFINIGNYKNLHINDVSFGEFDFQL